MRPKIRSILPALVVTLVATAGIGCGDGGSDNVSPTPTEAAGPTETAGPTTEASAEVVEAAAAYLEETGIDGTKGAFTEPLNCPEMGDEPESEFCLHQSISIFSPGEVILIIGDSDNPNERAWQMRLRPAESGWEVSGVEPHGSTE